MSVHISAQPGEIAKIVLLAGDPLRAKYIADNFLQEVKLVSSTRNIYFFTGTYKNKPVTVGASGMGCPSIGIYSYELFTEYEADCIIRVGTCGAYTEKMKLFDLINVDMACSESTYAKCAFGYKKDKFKHRGNTFDTINKTAKELQLELKTGPIHSGDVFYRAEKGKGKGCKIKDLRHPRFSVYADKSGDLYPQKPPCRPCHTERKKQDVLLKNTFAGRSVINQVLQHRDDRQTVY